MRIRKSVNAPVLVGFLLLSVSCGKNSGGGNVNVTARFLNGATPTPGSGGSWPETSGRTQALTGLPADGSWLISPNKLRLTVNSISLHSGTGAGADAGNTTNANPANCVITYDISQVGLSKLVDCPFTLSAGTYRSTYIGFNATYDVLINDSTNGIYTDSSSPSLLRTGSPPPTGAQFVTVTSNSSGSTFGAGGNLPQAITLNTGDSSTLSIVVNGLQFLKVTISNSGAQAAFGWYGIGDPFRPDMAVSFNAVGKIGYYVRTDINTALSYVAGGGGPARPQGIDSVAVNYSSATSPSTLYLGFSGNPPGCNTPPPGPRSVGGVISGPPNGGGLGGYLGLDTNGVLGWALATDDSWATYATEFSMPQKSNLGDSTTLKCKNISSDPSPPGGTFASGAPNIATADYSANYVLVAK